MIQKITKKFLVALLAIALISANLTAYAYRGMKDIELDPGKGENVGNMMKTFPTISSTQVTVNFFFETDDHVTLTVYDMQGRIVDPGAEGFVPKARLHESIIDVNTLANGTYFVKLAQDNGTVLTSKFVVQH